MTIAHGRYQRLDPVFVQATVDRLALRIARRFPTRHLGGIAVDAHQPTFS